MSVFDSVSVTPVVLRADRPLDEAQLAAVAFLARYRAARWSPTAPTCASSSSGPATSAAAARRHAAHIELYRASMDERGPAASTLIGDCQRCAACPRWPCQRGLRDLSGLAERHAEPVTASSMRVW